MARLTDRFGLDWWELTSILVHQQLESVLVLRLLVETLDPLDEVYVSRPCFQAEVLRISLVSRVHVFAWRGTRHKRGARHYLRVLKKFPARQLLEIFWDKTDPGYQFRGSLGSLRKPLSDAVVLLPSAYVNVSRTGVAYAESLPEARFLLVVTRRSGWIQSPPANVAMTWLRRYASVRVPSRELECKDLVRRWEALRDDLSVAPEFRILDALACFDDFGDRFARGLEIRDAWRNVFDTEPVRAVLCADDSNPYTHIPLLLAAQKGLPTIACHHGALDGRHMFKRNHADVVLAKGEMERDYLVRLCGVPSARVEIGAPMLRHDLQVREAHEESAKSRPYIVFFSEAYETGGGRARGFYQDILPALADLALAEGRQLVIKLHPSESFSERSRLVEQILRPERQPVARVVSGPLQPEMLNRTWFGVTVLSTVVTECALRGIPCFLCAWLESWPYGYVDQFTHFGIGIRLSEPSQISEILALLRNYKAERTQENRTHENQVQENCWSPIERERLQALLGIGQEAQRATAAKGLGARIFR
jgi:hypothetical protein